MYQHKAGGGLWCCMGGKRWLVVPRILRRAAHMAYHDCKPNATDRRLQTAKVVSLAHHSHQGIAVAMIRVLATQQTSWTPTDYGQ